MASSPHGMRGRRQPDSIAVASPRMPTSARRASHAGEYMRASAEDFNFPTPKMKGRKAPPRVFVSENEFEAIRREAERAREELQIGTPQMRAARNKSSEARHRERELRAKDFTDMITPQLQGRRVPPRILTEEAQWQQGQAQKKAPPPKENYAENSMVEGAIDIFWKTHSSVSHRGRDYISREEYVALHQRMSKVIDVNFAVGESEEAALHDWSIDNPKDPKKMKFSAFKASLFQLVDLWMAHWPTRVTAKDYCEWLLKLFGRITRKNTEITSDGRRRASFGWRELSDIRPGWDDPEVVPIGDIVEWYQRMHAPAANPPAHNNNVAPVRQHHPNSQQQNSNAMRVRVRSHSAGPERGVGGVVGVGGGGIPAPAASGAVPQQARDAAALRLRISARR